MVVRIFPSEQSGFFANDGTQSRRAQGRGSDPRALPWIGSKLEGKARQHAPIRNSISARPLREGEKMKLFGALRFLGALVGAIFGGSVSRKTASRKSSARKPAPRKPDPRKVVPQKTAQKKSAPRRSATRQPDPGSGSGQYYDEHGRYAGREDDSGRRFDAHGNYSGRVDSKGRSYDKSGLYAGRIDKSGRRFDAHGRYMGRTR